MRINVYAEEMTDRVEIVTKTNSEGTFTGVRLYLYMPVTTGPSQMVKGPFEHRPGDDDSSAITFWGKQDLRGALIAMLCALDRAGDRGAMGTHASPIGANKEFRG